MRAVKKPKPDEGFEPAAPALDRDQQTATRAAWLYYVENLTQDEIARRLGLNRVRVNRILAQARESGIVQIRITSKLADCVALEARLVERFGLAGATVVPTPDNPDLVPQAIAIEAGIALSERIRPGSSIGIGWGRTLRLSLRTVESRTMQDVSVVSMIGGLTRGSVLNAYETAFHLADLIGAACYYIAGPVFTDTRETRDVLMRQGLVQEALERARGVDVALVSVGSLQPESTMQRLGLVADDEAAELRQAGAVGDICGFWIDAEGRLVDHPLNQRVIGIKPEELAGIPTVILASGGADKSAVLRAALVLGVVDVLVTDAKSAEALLAAPTPVARTPARRRRGAA
ncbi:MAG TPA: sugar-binding transcriptional regulator [Microvirga sp.]|nr:sugar-binding transcriptional regulator [Microvirga sp.]